MNDLSPLRQNKFKAYRARKRAAGLREVRLWVPDFSDPVLKAALDDQIRRINASEDEAEVMAMGEELAVEVWNMPD